MATICNKSVTLTTSDGATGTGSFYIDYSVSNSATAASITTRAVVAACLTKHGRNTSQGYSCSVRNYSSTSGWYVNGVQTLATDTSTTATSTTVGQTVTATLQSAGLTINKTHSTQNILVETSFGLYTRVYGYKYRETDHTTCDVSGTIQIGPKSSYTVSYNLNGGAGTVPSQTKWHDEPLTLTTAKPTKENYKFKGWATTLAKAQVGTVDVGTTYSGNTAVTYYAVWELNNYQKPVISNVSVERCSQSGQLLDDGTCALVSFDWSVFRSDLARYYGGTEKPFASNAINSCSITVGSSTITPTVSGTSGHVSEVVGSAYGSDQQYNASISVTDTQSLISDHTTTATGTLPTQYFPMDYNGDASAVGFFMPAPDNNEGAHFGKDVHIYINTAAGSGTDYTINQALQKLGWTSLLE